MSASFLMCPPDFFEITYEINPWMHRKHQPDRVKAREQWTALHDLMVNTLCANVGLIKPVETLPDMVFTANAGIAVNKLFVRSNFRHPERAKEEIYFDRWFREQGYEVKLIERPHPFEGEGDVLFMGNDFYAGYHFRSDVESHDKLAGILRCSYHALELKDKRFYHLDTCFSPLDSRSALVYLNAFETYAQLTLLETVEDPIRITEEEALKLVCNAIVFDRNVILPQGCPRVEKELEERGFRVHALDFSEFIKAGGAAKCLVLNLNRTLQITNPKFEK